MGQITLEDTKVFVRRCLPKATDDAVEAVARKIVKAFAKYKLKVDET